MAVLKIFPNGRGEFPTEDDLCMWLLTALKSRNGEYRLKNPSNIATLTPGSIVLFRFGLHKIVGEAIVVRTSHSTDDDEYPVSVWFSPSSIRLFVPAIPIAKVQELIGGKENKDISTVANAYANIDEWSVYPEILASHFDSGGHLL